MSKEEGGRQGDIQGVTSFLTADTGPGGVGFAGATTWSFCAAKIFTVETEAGGSPWGFWSVITSSLRKAKKSTALRTGREGTYFLKRTSLRRSTPPLTLSAKKTFPVVAIATIWECSLKGLNEIGSWYSPEALRA